MGITLSTNTYYKSENINTVAKISNPIPTETKVTQFDGNTHIENLEIYYKDIEQRIARLNRALSKEPPQRDILASHVVTDEPSLYQVAEKYARPDENIFNVIEEIKRNNPEQFQNNDIITKGMTLKVYKYDETALKEYEAEQVALKAEIKKWQDKAAKVMKDINIAYGEIAIEKLKEFGHDEKYDMKLNSSTGFVEITTKEEVKFRKIKNQLGIPHGIIREHNEQTLEKLNYNNEYDCYDDMPAPIGTTFSIPGKDTNPKKHWSFWGK